MVYIYPNNRKVLVMFLDKFATCIYWPNKDWMSGVDGIQLMLFGRIYIVIAWSSEGEATVEEI